MRGYQTSATNNMNSLDNNRFAEDELPPLCPLAAKLELWDRKQIDRHTKLDLELGSLTRKMGVKFQDKLIVMFNWIIRCK